jgi:predicted transcriptional regulator
MRRLVLPFLMTLLLLPGMALAELGLPPLSSTPPAEQSAPAAPPVGGSPLDNLFGNLSLTGGLVLGVGLALVAVAASLFFLGGAKFVNSGNVLENDARRSIFEYIQQHPGVHLRAAATALDLSTTNVLWHLRKLEDANLVTSKKFEGYKVFYPVEGGVETKRKAIAASVLKNDNAQQILQYVTANPSAHQREIARALGVNHGTVRWHLRKLEEAELVTPVRKEHTTHYYVSELGHESMRTIAQRALAPQPVPPTPPAAAIPGDEGQL